MAIFKKENGQLVDFSNPIPDTSIAPIENGATSTHNYVVGAYALVKGILKKVTNAISIGTAFSDSNSETTDVATELKELNDDVTTINTHLLLDTVTFRYSTSTVTIPAGTTQSFAMDDITIWLSNHPDYRVLSVVSVETGNTQLSIEGFSAVNTCFVRVHNNASNARESSITMTVVFQHV